MHIKYLAVDKDISKFVKFIDYQLCNLYHCIMRYRRAVFILTCTDNYTFLKAAWCYDIWEDRYCTVKMLLMMVILLNRILWCSEYIISVISYVYNFKWPCTLKLCYGMSLQHDMVKSLRRPAVGLWCTTLKQNKIHEMPTYWFNILIFVCVMKCIYTSAWSIITIRSCKVTLQGWRWTKAFCCWCWCKLRPL